MTRAVVLTGSNLDLLPQIPTGSIDSICCDPPYGMAFMGRNWDKALPDPRTWAECFRVLKPGGHMVAFGAPRLYHRLAVQIEDAAPWEIRDCLSWLYGSGFPKNHDVSKAIDKAAGHWRGKAGAVSTTNGSMGGPNYERTPKGDPITPTAAQWEGWGTALKPAWEPILLARKPLDGTVARNVLAYGTGAINVDATRIGDAGRWPANLILDEEAGAALGEPSRFFYCAKASRAEREEGLDDFTGGIVNDGRATSIDNPYQRGDTVRKNRHPTVKPIALMRWLVRLITPPNGIVLDPFNGSGSTGCAAMAEGFQYLGMELDPEHAETARARIRHWEGK